jgi:hypothetical protein
LNHVLLAQVALSFLCAVQGLATLAIDFNRTHATNPLWPGHARFHLVWQSISIALLSILEIVLIWWQGPYQRENFYLASILAAVSPLGFILAWMGRRIFGGTLSDPNGIPPVRLMLSGRQFCIDLNLAAVVAALISLLVILGIY